jgi:hypothetical protein
LSVLRQIGVALQFVVAPAFAAGVVHPFGRIGRGAISAVEFVAPDERPARSRRRLESRPAAATKQDKNYGEKRWRISKRG